jgi:predicted ArsR family transcriptional regulator
MACVGSRGELTESARKMLAALKTPATPEDVATHTELPLFRVRGGLREMVEAGLVELKDGAYSPTELGRPCCLHKGKDLGISRR